MEVLRDERVAGDFSFVHVPSLQPAHRCPFRFRASTPPVPVLSTFPSLHLPGRASPPPHAVLRHLFRKCFLMPSRSTASRPQEVLRQNLMKCCVKLKRLGYGVESLFSIIKSDKNIIFFMLAYVMRIFFRIFVARIISASILQ